MSKSFADDFDKDGTYADEFTPPEEITERFEVLECLAENDKGETFLLEEKANGSRFVLKSYKKSNTSGETSESEILRSLKHRGLPGFEAEIEDDNYLYVLREYAEGMPLTVYMEEQGGKLSTVQAVDIAAMLCDILTYLHAQIPPIIHRDVKPSNIIYNPDDNSIKLIDFGISRRFSEDTDTDTTYYGTKKFSPPEQYGFAQTDCRADIYALGVVLRYMLTGKLDGQHDDRRLARIINKCTAFSPDDRYKNAGVLKKDLLRYRGGTKLRVLKSLTVALCLCVVLAVGFFAVRYTGLLPQTGLPFLSGQAAFDNIDDEPVVFVEPLIEEAVRVMLGKEDDEAILRGELERITQLYIYGTHILKTEEEYHATFSIGYVYGTIATLDDVRIMQNIRSIMLCGQPLTDVSPLADCPMLEAVTIERSPVTDVSSLASLPRLRWLMLYECSIDDVSYFASFETLENLALGRMPHIDVSKLSAPQTLRFLDLSGLTVRKLEEIRLERLPRLEEITITGTQIDNFSLLNDFTNIKRMFISPDMEQYLNTMARDDIEVVVW